MVSLRYAGTDMIYNKEGFDFNWFRAMDNDKRDYLPTTVKKQAFDWKQATDKKSVTITTSLEATVGSGTQKWYCHSTSPIQSMQTVRSM